MAMKPFVLTSLEGGDICIDSFEGMVDDSEDVDATGCSCCMLFDALIGVELLIPVPSSTYLFRAEG